MEPLTKIGIGGSKWLGLLSVTCTVAGELLHLANMAGDQRTTFVDREMLRRAFQARAKVWQEAVMMTPDIASLLYAFAAALTALARLLRLFKRPP